MRNRKELAFLAALTLLAAASAWSAGSKDDGAMGSKSVEISLLKGQNENDNILIDALAEAYSAANPNVTFNLEIPAGQSADIENMVRTRLATGAMNDIFYFNSGSLLQTLNPSDTLVDISGEAFMGNVAESFIPTVSDGKGTYGVPVGYAAAGGILYNKRIFEEYGLSIPTTWAEFAANNEVLKAAGVAPVVQTYGDNWTSQLFVLADYYNVEQANPGFADDYTANMAKFADTPEAVASFRHLQEGLEKNWYQKDFATAKFDQGLEMLAKGTVPQYPMLTQVMPTITNNWPEAAEDIGYFALPGTSASSNGATVWMPLALFIPKSSDYTEIAKDFFALVASVEGTDVLTAAAKPAGPYLIKGATLPSDVLPFVKDLQGYIQSGNSYPALEFLSPIKGPSLPNFCVAVGTGQMTPAQAAASYDQDVAKQAEQLGIAGW